ncbi:MAG: ATP synthase F1 subunit delta [Rickettsia endosymbiont of Pentastiridius leporinus]
MTQNNLIENYAVALFNNAKIDNIVDKIFDEITLVNSFIEDNFKIKEFLFSPVIDKTDKIKLINSLVKSIKISTMLQNFLLLLIKNSRTNILSDIVEAYNRLLCKSKNIKIVQIVSASKLQPKEQEWIKASLEKELKQETKINFEVDPTIIGGIIIKYDSILQDYSIKNSLAKIATTLKSVRVAA